jgi:hypothetical protein
MRALIIALILFISVGTAACNASPPTITPAPDEGAVLDDATLEPGAEEMTVDVRNSQVAVGLERIAFDLADASGAPVNTPGEADIVFYKLSEIQPGANQLQRSASGKALYFGESMPHGGSWVVYNDFDTSGPWAFDVSLTGDDGTVSQGRGRLEVAGRIDTPRLGQQPPTTDTPKLGDGVELAGLTTDPKPVEALYEMTVGEALASGKPTMVHFGSPAHCETDDCAATLLQVQKIGRQQGDNMNIIHIESRDLEDPTQLSQTALEWGLPSEPWTFLFDDRGFLVARVEGPIENVELGLLIKQMLP